LTAGSFSIECDARNGIERDADAHGALEAFRRRVSDRCLPVDCSDQ
jgi:hypothetical protein